LRKYLTGVSELIS